MEVNSLLNGNDQACIIMPYAGHVSIPDNGN